FSILASRPPAPMLFPYTTLFRSGVGEPVPDARGAARQADGAIGAQDDVLDLDSCVPRGVDQPFERPREHHAVEHDGVAAAGELRSEEHTSELQSRGQLVCRLLLE